MQITDDIYKKVWEIGRGLRIFNCLKKEEQDDIVQLVVIALINLNPDKLDPYINKLIHNKIIDNKRKKAPILFDNFMFIDKEEEICLTDEMLEIIKKTITQEEYDWLIQYYSSKNKSVNEKVRAHRLIKKIKKNVDTN